MRRRATGGARPQQRDGIRRILGSLTKLLLTRHGHIDGIRPKRFRGRAELALTELGLRQADALAARIAAQWKPAAIHTSGMQRCVVTGQKIAQASGVTSTVLVGLMDLDYGAWQMRIQDEVAAEEPELFHLWHAAPHLVRFPGGESLQDLVARTSDALRLVLARHGGQTVVMVGHDSVNRALLLQFLDQPLSAYWKLAQDPCCLNEIDIEGDKVQVQRINDTSHLDRPS
jgi:broad specificity phosphatase PhoE